MSTKKELNLRPLRVAGQSTDERLREQADQFWPYLIIATALLLLAITDWQRHWTHSPPSPWVTTFLATAGMACCVWKFVTLRDRTHRLRQGRNGERVVAEQLERLRSQGFYVVHDLVADNFNLDHVLVGPSGVFAVETKALSRRKGDQIKYDGQNLEVAGCIRNAASEQAKRQAKWLRGLLQMRTGRNFFIMPVLVFPEWSIVEAGPQSDLIILHPKRLFTLTQRRTILQPNEVALIVAQLEMFVRIEAQAA